jgi:plasmid maintenance system antidote protein VapI
MATAARTKAPRAKFDVERVVADMALRGWNNTDLARAASISSMTVTRFMRGEAQTAKTAERIARALGFSVRRYFSHVEQVA